MNSGIQMKNKNDQSAKTAKSRSILSSVLSEFVRKTESDKRIAMFGSDPLKS